MSTHDWTTATAPELNALAARGAGVLVPIGSIEQHGPHLPVDVDARLARAVALAAAERAAPDLTLVVAPTVSVGIARHHVSLGGTLTLDEASFTAVLEAIRRSIVAAGFGRIALVNGHGGNHNAMKVVVNALARDLEVPLLACTYWDLARASFREILEAQPCVMHAGEAETSMMLALAPELVHMDRLEGGAPPSFAGQSDPFEPPLYRAVDMADVSPSGILGFPDAASAEKGRRLIAAAADALAGALASARDWRLTASSADTCGGRPA